MTKDQEKFLELAVIKQYSYKQISEDNNLDRNSFTKWWEEFKEERLKLSEARKIWKKKCPETDFRDAEELKKFYAFKDWYEKKGKACYYCKITKEEMDKLWIKDPELTKRSRGKKLEIERKKPNDSYSDLDNLVWSCYWCNNAKTDTFTEDEFKKIGAVIEEIWNGRLRG